MITEVKIASTPASVREGSIEDAGLGTLHEQVTPKPKVKKRATKAEREANTKVTLPSRDGKQELLDKLKKGGV